MPNGRCYRHGGATPHGAALPQFKHGRYSKYVPKHLAEVYERVRKDKELLNLSDDVALLIARETELLEGLEEAPSWKEAMTAYKMFTDSKRNNAKNLAMLGQILENGVLKAQSRDRTWNKLLEIFKEHRDMATAEHNRRMELRAALTAEEAMAFGQAVVETMLKVVTDTSIPREDIPKLVHREAARLMPKEAAAQ